MPEEAKKNAAEQAAQAQKQPVPMPTTYEALRHDLIASGRAYDFDMIDRAYQLASAAHATQFRRSDEPDRKSTRLNSSHLPTSRMPSSA